MIEFYFPSIFVAVLTSYVLYLFHLICGAAQAVLLLCIYSCIIDTSTHPFIYHHSIPLEKDRCTYYQLHEVCRPNYSILVEKMGPPTVRKA